MGGFVPSRIGCLPPADSAAFLAFAGDTPLAAPLLVRPQWLSAGQPTPPMPARRSASSAGSNGDCRRSNHPTRRGARDPGSTDSRPALIPAGRSYVANALVSSPTTYWAKAIIRSCPLSKARSGSHVAAARRRAMPAKEVRPWIDPVSPLGEARVSRAIATHVRHSTPTVSGGSGPPFVAAARPRSDRELSARSGPA
jgi:hypothetical protein